MNSLPVSDGLRWGLDVCVEGEGRRRKMGGRKQWMYSMVNKDP